MYKNEKPVYSFMWLSSLVWKHQDEYYWGKKPLQKAHIKSQANTMNYLTWIHDVLCT